MAKEKQKMTLSVRRRNVEAAPPAIDPAQIEAFANGADNAKKAAVTKTVESRAVVQKVVRDAFTMPAQDHALFAAIQRKCLDLGIVVSKSEIVRAGLLHFAEIDAAELQKIISAVPKLKTGRPGSEKLESN